ncbi:MAG: hypothetical protein NW237_16990 [Cyanobacteriota bacterium]|nr:hypothetical protein [Cyanobacteriota bacterium]
MKTRDGGFVIDRYQFYWETPCRDCRHFVWDGECAAFPNGIPLEIWDARNDHRQPYPGDHGIQFEPMPLPIKTR